MQRPSQQQRQSKYFWSKPIDTLQSELQCRLTGLKADEVSSQRAVYGANVLSLQSRRSLLLDYLIRFRNPLVLLLIAAASIAAVLGDTVTSLLTAALVICSVTLDYWQERKAGNAAERLRAAVALRCLVLRDGALQSVATTELVPGDVVELTAGDLVPADAYVIEARDFFVQQSALTGESYPVEKLVRLEGIDAELTAADNAVFTGSSVLSGHARALVCATGRASFLGDVAASLHAEPPPTAFEIGVHRFGQMIMQLTLLLVLFVVVVNTMAQRPMLETLMFAVALAVGLTPELLPMIVSVTLARGALRLSANHVIVKRLAAIQDLGSMDVLCTDKTGTLTEGVVRLERHVDLEGRDSARVLLLAYLNSRFESGLRSSLDDAIVQHEDVDIRGWQKLDEVPFGFERRRVSVLVAQGAERLLIVKGAPEDILRLSTQMESGPESAGALLPLDAAARLRAQMQFESLSQTGFRVLAIAWRRLGPEHSHVSVHDETELVLCGFAAFFDPPKTSAAAALTSLRKSRVAVKVVTGDNELVTQYVCAQLGLQVQGLLTGAQIEQLDDHALAARAQRANVFCRVTPPQKTRILRALRSRGHVVGFLGDGINDAPALREADVGISVDAAVDVAKQAADLILLQRDLRVLHAGVIDGRRTFANVMKYLMMSISSNFGNMFSMAAATLFLPFFPMLSVQILLNNLLYDLSELALPADRVDARDLQRPHRWDPRFIRRFMLTLGPVSSLFDLLTFALLLGVFHAQETLFRTGWFIESIATQVLVVFVIRTRAAPWRSRPHPRLTVLALAVVALAIALPFTPLAPGLGFTRPPLTLLALVALLVLLYLASAEIAKRVFYRLLRRRRVLQHRAWAQRRELRRIQVKVEVPLK